MTSRPKTRWGTDPLRHAGAKRGLAQLARGIVLMRPDLAERMRALDPQQLDAIFATFSRADLVNAQFFTQLRARIEQEEKGG